MRTLVIDGQQYMWSVGKKHVEIRGPDNLKLTPTKVEATNGYHDWRDFEKGNASITPAMIEQYIRQYLSVNSVG